MEGLEGSALSSFGGSGYHFPASLATHTEVDFEARWAGANIELTHPKRRQYRAQWPAWGRHPLPNESSLTAVSRPSPVPAFLGSQRAHPPSEARHSIAQERSNSSHHHHNGGDGENVSATAFVMPAFGNASCH